MQRSCGRRAQRGQATLEYALVLAAFLSMVLAFAALAHVAEDGRLLGLARDASSHNADGGVTVALLQDLEAY